MEKTSWPDNGEEFTDIDGNSGIYFHVCNGGPQFIWQDGTLNVSVSAADVGMIAEVSFPLHGENLRELANWLLQTADQIDTQKKK